MDRIEQIKEMEAVLDRHNEAIADLKKALKKFRGSHKAYLKLVDYYDSEQFLQDYEMSNEGGIPEEIKCGVLSEDAVFDLIGDNYDISVEMVETALKALKNV